jgi:integrative and conjugative element protein (TIGR02256 family)
MDDSLVPNGNSLHYNAIPNARMSKLTETIAWVHRRVSEQLVNEAERAFPFETGGVLMGYWAKEYMEVVITDVIGPGPNSKHSPSGFVPDYSFQEAEIERIYEESNRFSTYLGDWHTHPLASCRPSFKDKHTLHRIASFPDARCAVPLMVILGGGKDRKWLLQIWKYRSSVLPAWIVCCATEPVETVLHDSTDEVA